MLGISEKKKPRGYSIYRSNKDTV